MPALRDWLCWNAEPNRFDNPENTERFYQLISPRVFDQGERRPPKLTTFSDVRSLKDVVQNQDALADLLQPERELVDALTISNRNRIAGRWRGEVNEAKTALQSIPAFDVAAFQDEDIRLITELMILAKRLLEMREAMAR